MKVRMHGIEYEFDSVEQYNEWTEDTDELQEQVDGYRKVIDAIFANLAYDYTEEDESSGWANAYDEILARLLNSHVDNPWEYHVEGGISSTSRQIECEERVRTMYE